MRKRLLLIFILLVTTSAFSQTKFSISGYMKDSASGESLIAATVYVEELAQGAAANAYGYYSLSIPHGKYTFRFSYVGYHDKVVVRNITQNISLNVELSPMSKVLESADVKSTRKSENIKSTDMSSVKLNIKTIQKIPAFLGEVDLVRVVQLMPGVTTVGEGATGFNVRGSSVDQNLVLLDEAPVFNSAHLFGFFSVFNPDAVMDVKLIKGGIPAVYGGRLASILDVRMKEGNLKEYKGTGGIGVIFSRLALEGPIVRNRGSFIIAGRRSYVDVLAKPFMKKELQGSRFYYYDFTAKGNYFINKNNRIFLSAYLGRDVFSASDIFGFDWGNQTVTARWNKVFNNRLFSNLTAYYSKYDYKIDVKMGESGFDWKSNIINYSIKPEFSYYFNPDFVMNFGGQSIFYTFVPGTSHTNLNGVISSRALDNRYSWENAVYTDFEHKINKKLNLRYGLRYSHFNYVGKGTTYYYRDTTANIRKPIEKTEKVGWLHSIASYGNIEPRLAITYTLDSFSSIKLSFNRMSQYLQLISNTTASIPLDVWTPATNNIPGQIANQYAAGYFRNFQDDKCETSVEVYYKSLQNQVDYIDNADLLLNELLEGDLLVGKGRAYGAEFFVRKHSGKLTGWISYTLARSERLVEGINRGKWYPARFDRAHNLNLVMIYEITKRISASGNFVYYTGTPATFPTNKYNLQGYIIPHIANDARNNYRIPPYHRLDLSITIQGKKRKRWESNWVFSVYNVYARRNPFSIYFQPNPEDYMQTQAVRFSVLGRAVPAITYNFNF
ncbi:MAG: TonB-dependent receptor [Bacteroidia bacterium]|nr:TonB-dependent receptor [Bacteroidia bacterium]